MQDTSLLCNSILNTVLTCNIQYCYCKLLTLTRFKAVMYPPHNYLLADRFTISHAPNHIYIKYIYISNMVKYLENLLKILFVLLLFFFLSCNDCNNKMYLILSYNIIKLLFIYNYYL